MGAEARSVSRRRRVVIDIVFSSCMVVDQSRGSKRSRRPSPSKLQPSTVRKIAAPWNQASQGASSMKPIALRSMFPQVGVGG